MKDLGKYYKSKYLALRAQYIKTIDFAFQEGYVKGQEDAQMQQAVQQQQEAQLQAQQAQAMSQMGGQGGASGEEMPPEMGGATPPEGEMYDGQSPQEIDSLINELQQTIQKSEIALPSLQKSLDRLTNLKNSKKSMGYANNLAPAGKLALNEQEKLVANLIKKWDSESANAASEMMSALRTESIK